MQTIQQILQSFEIGNKLAAASTGTQWIMGDNNPSRTIQSPVDGYTITSVSLSSETEWNSVINSAEKAYLTWRTMPAPKRGEIVRQIGDELRKHKDNLGALVSYEMGKSLQEGLGEVQEMIDICDFAVGLSRQLHGLTMHSERPNHRKTPASAAAVQHILKQVLINNQLPEGIFCLVQGDRTIGEMMSTDSRIALVSATGSTRMGKEVAIKVAARLGKSILELGGNNAIILTPEANLDMAIIAILFGAVGTAGQRCTTTRRLIIHESIYSTVKDKLCKAYAQLKIGNPLEQSNHVGPLIDTDAVNNYQNAITNLLAEGGTVLYGNQVLTGDQYQSGCYVVPTICEGSPTMKTVQEETFAPILYLLKYQDLDQAIATQNAVKQGLSSAIFTNNLQEAEAFLSAKGSDCGIANVNIGTSGAEIGGAFGGEKETGGGRESGSDAWKAYMRRQTNTINYGATLPLAQGIKFDF